MPPTRFAPPVPRWVRMSLAVLAVSAGLLPALSPPATASPRIVWGECPFPVGTSRATCGTLRVPVDYRHPGGAAIDIAVSRVRSQAPDRRRGVLVINEGGPAAHLGDASTFDRLAPQSLRDRYDVVSFDQRGFGHSAPVTCRLDDRQQHENIPWPGTGGVAGTAARAKQVADQCGRYGGPVMAHMGTAYVARDLDLLRQALGESKLNYLGYSYGTYLGTAYASLFPRHTDRMLVDGVVGPSMAWRDEWRTSLGPGVDERFGDFARFAAAGSYGLGRTSGQVHARFVALARALDRRPLQTPQGVLTGDQLRMAVFVGLYDDSTFPLLASLGRAAQRHDASAAGQAGDSFQLWWRDPTDNDTAAKYGVICGDARWPHDLDVYRRDVRADARRYPLTAGAGSNVWPCAFWPYPPDETVRTSPRGSQILIINNLRDPATPYVGAKELRTALGSRARLVTVDQGGHTTYLTKSDRCANDIGTAYLEDGLFPADDVHCPAP
ncbi:alpha/beta hydrolase [Actinoallomurus bryophytorum]|uniref:Alpha/beta hydrolase family protein n=1 Tax=Actinoallomurus bryophytorum TaxID=1490222 RepID=A0A543CT56_9ACTN|nr:alpha/beta hydrolase [Actinoallomurus bryophytorum]TQM00098.1 alpha/beta hydrolase family protein [Actinoallomurus bryophytorum]